MSEAKQEEQFAVHCLDCDKWFRAVDNSGGTCPHCGKDSDKEEFDTPVFISLKDVKFLNYNWDTLQVSPPKAKEN